MIPFYILNFEIKILVKDYNKKVKKKTIDENLNQALINCKDLGFKEGTEKFGECVLKLSE